MEDSNRVNTTMAISEEGEKETVVDQRPEISAEEARKYRRAAARLIYIAQGRPRIAVAAGVLAGIMLRPRAGDAVRPKRAVRDASGRVPVASCAPRLRSRPREPRALPAALFCDFRTAFPSLARAWMMAVLVRTGIPEHIMRVIRQLYAECDSLLLFAGEVVAAMTVTSGIKQGCLVSGSFFRAHA